MKGKENKPNFSSVFCLGIRKILACNPCKRMNAFKIKHNFYYKNINNQLNY